MPARDRLINLPPGCRSRFESVVAAILCGAVLLVVAGCSGSDVSRLPPQQWGDIVVIVEPRPAPVRPGMTEFLVLLTETRGVVVADAVVSIRTHHSQPWKQGIQDGHSGVFRKAIAVGPDNRLLAVNIRRGEQSTELFFPLYPASAGN